MAPKKRCQFRTGTDAQGTDAHDAQVTDAHDAHDAQVTDAQCKFPALRIAGQCALCRAWFCSDHRMPEHHSCNDLEDCRKQAFELNKLKLEAERTVAPKMVMA